MTPAVGATIHTPTVGATVHTPIVGATVHAPAVGATVHAPALGATVHAPAVGATIHAPTLGTTVHAPTVGATIHAPALGATVHAPAVGATVHAPALGTTVAAPPRSSTIPTMEVPIMMEIPIVTKVPVPRTYYNRSIEIRLIVRSVRGVVGWIVRSVVRRTVSVVRGSLRNNRGGGCGDVHAPCQQLVSVGRDPHRRIASDVLLKRADAFHAGRVYEHRGIWRHLEHMGAVGCVQR